MRRFLILQEYPISWSVCYMGFILWETPLVYSILICVFLYVLYFNLTIFKSCLTQKLKYIEASWIEISPWRRRKKSKQNCGRQLLGHYFISGLLSLTNPKAKISKLNFSLASTASTQPDNRVFHAFRTLGCQELTSSGHNSPSINYNCCLLRFFWV